MKVFQESGDKMKAAAGRIHAAGTAGAYQRSDKSFRVSGRSDHPEPYTTVRTLGFVLSQMESHWKTLSRERKKNHSGCPVQNRQQECKGRGRRELLPPRRREVLPWAWSAVVGGLRKH